METSFVHELRPHRFGRYGSIIDWILLSASTKRITDSDISDLTKESGAFVLNSHYIPVFYPLSPYFC